MEIVQIEPTAPSSDMPCRRSAGPLVVSDGISVAENLYEAGCVISPHSHQSALIALTLSGAYTECHASGAREYPAGSASFRPPRHEHAVHVGTRAVRCFTVEIPDRHIERLRAVAKTDLRIVTDERGSLVWLLARLRDEVSAVAAPSPLVIEGMIVAMLGVVAQMHCRHGDRREPRWIGKVAEFLRSEFHEDLTVTLLAERVGVHPVHLSRTWRHFRGRSIGETLQQTRIAAACQRLAAGAASSLSALALDLGFSDQSHFTRVFKHATGMTPASYRRQFAQRHR